MRRNNKRIRTRITKWNTFKISKSLNDSTVSKFVTKKWIEVNDLSGGQYYVDRNVRFNTPMLRSDVCDYNDANIVVKETIILEGTNANNRTDKKLSFKNNPPFRSCISKINDTLIDNAEDLDFVMLMYNQLEYSDNFSKTSESL